jgi:hypothetical protein
MKIIKPTSEDQTIIEKYPTVFLAGSIEMGVAEDWQTILQNELETLGATVSVFNPRRDSWDSSWEQRKSNPEFSYQVNWEMDKLEESDIIFMYFSPETKSPISLLELGLHSSSEKMIVVCPDGFWRKGNVEIVCDRHNIPLYDNLNEGVSILSNLVSNKQIK